MDTVSPVFPKPHSCRRGHRGRQEGVGHQALFFEGECLFLHMDFHGCWSSGSVMLKMPVSSLPLPPEDLPLISSGVHIPGISGNESRFLLPPGYSSMSEAGLPAGRLSSRGCWEESVSRHRDPFFAITTASETRGPGGCKGARACGVSRPGLRALVWAGN